MPEISIIIVNWNQFDLTSDCIRSVRRWSGGLDVEFVVVDNGSSAPGLEDFRTAFPDIRLHVNSRNLGFAAANNQGMELATAPIWLLLNNDTLFMENTLDVCLRTLEHIREEAIIGCRLLNRDGSIQISVNDLDTVSNVFGEYWLPYAWIRHSKRFNKYHVHEADHNLPIEVDVVKGAFMMARASTFRSLGGFDESFYFYNEENDLCLRHLRNGGKVVFEPRTSVIHFGGASTDTVPWFRQREQALAKLRYFIKHMRGWRLAAVLAIHYAGYAVRVPLYAAWALFSGNRQLLWRSVHYARCLALYPRS